MTAPLGTPDEIRLPDPPARIHLVGIGGIGVSGLARMLAARGYQVSGSDLQASPITEALVSEGIAVWIGHAASHVTGADLVVTTAAAPPTNPELVAATEAGIPIVKRAALLGLVSRDSISLAVAGSHGKSTTSGMAAVALDAAGLSPSFAVGAVVPQLGTNARAGSGRYFVAEADEYDRSFLWLAPDVAIITNIEHDHPDIFPTFEDVLEAFRQFAGKLKRRGTLVVSAEDAGARELAAGLSGVQVVTFGANSGDWRIDERGVVRAPGERTFELPLSVPGRHNQLNALAVLAAADALDIDPTLLIPGLSSFTGVGRRFQVLVDRPELTVIDDYAHHPTEVRATIAAAREGYPGRRVLAVFQPHTYSRTLALLGDFAAALELADEVVIAEIYPARETDTLGVSSRSIAERMAAPAAVGEDLDGTLELVNDFKRDGDVVLVMGAGDIYRVAERLAGD